MDFEKLKQHIENLIKRGDEEENPCYYISAQGMIRGVLDLCGTDGVLLPKEVAYLINTDRKLMHKNLILFLKEIDENNEQ